MYISYVYMVQKFCIQLLDHQRFKNILFEIDKWFILICFLLSMTKKKILNGISKIYLKRLLVND